MQAQKAEGNKTRYPELKKHVFSRKNSGKLDELHRSKETRPTF